MSGREMPVCYRVVDRHVLLDGGSTSQKKVGTYVILPYLKQQGISCLEAVVLTHTDQDHINGVMEVLEEGKKAG